MCQIFFCFSVFAKVTTPSSAPAYGAMHLMCTADLPSCMLSSCSAHSSSEKAYRLHLSRCSTYFNTQYFKTLLWKTIVFQGAVPRYHSGFCNWFGERLETKLEQSVLLGSLLGRNMKSRYTQEIFTENSWNAKPQLINLWTGIFLCFLIKDTEINQLWLKPLCVLHAWKQASLDSCNIRSPLVMVICMLRDY